MAVSAAIFWYVGWQVVAPFDPDGPVTLLMVDRGVVAMAELLGLAVITSGLAVAFCGAGSADRGPLAIAVGLATLGLRSARIDTLVLYRMNPPGPEQQTILDPFPAWELIAECWLWLALIAVGFVVGRWVDSWHTSAPNVATPDSKTLADQAPDFRTGLGTIIVAALVAWGVLSFAGGKENHPYLTGQIYFAVGLAFLIGSLVAHGFFRESSRAWSLIAIGVVAAAAYALGGPDERAIVSAQKTHTYLNIRPIARPLPLVYASMGAIGVLLKDDAMFMLRSLVGLQAEDTNSEDDEN